MLVMLVGILDLAVYKREVSGPVVLFIVLKVVPEFVAGSIVFTTVYESEVVDKLVVVVDGVRLE